MLNQEEKKETVNITLKKSRTVGVSREQSNNWTTRYAPIIYTESVQKVTSNVHQSGTVGVCQKQTCKLYKCKYTRMSKK